VLRKKIKDKNQFFLIGATMILLFSIYLKPSGLINFEKYEGKDLLIAYRKGGGNCNTYFRLKENNRFTERSRCFAVTSIKGTYKIKGDTIFFDNIEQWFEEDYYKYAIIDRSDPSQNGLLFRYHNEDEPIKKYDLWITKDNLPK